MLRRWLSWRLVGLARRLNPDLLAALIACIDAEPEAADKILKDYNKRYPLPRVKDLA